MQVIIQRGSHLLFCNYEKNASIKKSKWKMEKNHIHEKIKYFSLKRFGKYEKVDDIPFKICRILLPISLPTYMFSHHIYHHHIFREEMEDVVGSVFDLMGRTSDPILEEEVINERVDHLFEVNCLLKHWWILFCWTSFIYSEWISMEMVWSHLMSFWKLAWEMNTLPDQLSNLVLLWFKLPKIIIDVSHKYTLEF